MRMRPVPILLVALAAFTAAGCTESAASERAAPTLTSSAAATPSMTTPATGGADATEPPPPKTPTVNVDYRRSYGWGVPSGEVTVNHPLSPPIAPPPASPLPYLVAIYVADHPEGSPKYSRISFYFRRAVPSYRLQYVKQVLSEGKGAPISLEGNSFLRIQFVDAQTYDSGGKSTVRVAPKLHIGLANLKSYGFGGDFEGYVTYGLGIQVSPNSDQALAIRAGELTKPDGSGGQYYVIHVDVRNG